ncbi:MAG: type II toxin-antitoxin system RelE/ParE family toxin [Oscillospiraceae bacterium]|nr:type II toxin-antitoxin system RelE/ParE family toxin [Oscillospiraceae bacterium]
MKLKYRPAAISDIQNACGYIRDQLKNPKAAKNLKSKLLSGASLLKDSPYMGTSLDSKFDGLETGIRFLAVSKHMIFYEVHDDRIEIVRILDGRTDYLSNLFG